jgi:hypothetical protein
MGVFIRAVITGFGFSLGKAIFDEVHKRLEKRRAAEAGAASETVPPVDMGGGHHHHPPVPQMA